MRLRDPPKYWKHGTRKYYILTYSVLALAVGFLAYMYIQVGHPVTFLGGSLSVVLATIIFSFEGPLTGSEAKKVAPLLGGLALAFTAGLFFTYFVLKPLGLREPYLIATSVSFMLATLIAFIYVAVTRRFLTRDT